MLLCAMHEECRPPLEALIRAPNPPELVALPPEEGSPSIFVAQHESVCDISAAPGRQQPSWPAVEETRHSVLARVARA